MKPGSRAAAAILTGAALLMLPALYNGYPLTFWDTRAYLEHAFTLEPRPDRLIGYSLFMRLFAFAGTLWPVALAQCLLVSAVVYVWLASERGRASPRRHVTVLAILCATTALPWVSQMLMADVFTPLLVLALYVLVDSDVHRAVRWLLYVLIALSVAVHLSHLWIGLGLLGAVAVFLRFRREPRVLHRVGAPAAALVAGLVAIAAFNYSRLGKVVLAQGSSAFVLAHLVESGLASAELDAHCPERDYWLCPHRARLPIPGDVFLWVDALDVHPWEQRDEVKREAQRLLGDSLREFPGLHLRVAVKYTLGAFFGFAAGEGFDSDAGPSIEKMMRRFVPGDAASFIAAREQTDRLPLKAISASTRVFGFALLAVWVAACAVSLRRGGDRLARPSIRFALFVFVALVVNAVLCGNLSGIHDRYQSRIFWLLGLSVFALWSARRADALSERLSERLSEPEAG